MSKEKKIGISIAAFIAVFAIISIGLWFLIRSLLPKTYHSAKEQCEKVLDQYQGEMEKIAVDSLESANNASGKFKEYSYICHKGDGLVVFSIDAQGMLGGQYWDLVYTEDGTFGGQTESYLEQDTMGNDIIRGEKLDEHWWYLWTDYDGTERSFH